MPAELVRELLDAGQRGRADGGRAAARRRAGAPRRRRPRRPRVAEPGARLSDGARGRAAAGVHRAGLRRGTRPCCASSAEAASAYAPDLRAARLRGGGAGRPRRARGWARAYRNNAAARAARGRRCSPRCAASGGGPSAGCSAAARRPSGTARSYEAGAHLRSSGPRLTHGGTSTEYAMAADAVAGFEPGPARRLPRRGLPSRPTLSIFDRFARCCDVGPRDRREHRPSAPSRPRSATRRCACCAPSGATSCRSAPRSTAGSTTQSGEDARRHQPHAAAARGRGGRSRSSRSTRAPARPTAWCCPASARPWPRRSSSTANRGVSCTSRTAARRAVRRGGDPARRVHRRRWPAPRYEHLLGSETRFRALAQNSSDVITLVDADGIVSYQSAAVGTVFGAAGDRAGRPLGVGLGAPGRRAERFARRAQHRRRQRRARRTASNAGFQHADGSLPASPRASVTQPARRADGRRARPQHPRHHRPQARRRPAAARRGARAHRPRPARRGRPAAVRDRAEPRLAVRRAARDGVRAGLARPPTSCTTRSATSAARSSPCTATSPSSRCATGCASSSTGPSSRWASRRR